MEDETVLFAERELDVMAVLWELESGTVTEVRERLPAELAYTTVLTILRNLEGKGFVRHEEEGKAHRYFPLVARKTAERSAVARLVDRLFQGSPELLLTRLVDDHDLSPEQLKRMRKRLRERLEDNNREDAP